jgi:hypothetical protein
VSINTVYLCTLYLFELLYEERGERGLREGKGGRICEGKIQHGENGCSKFDHN